MSAREHVQAAKAILRSLDRGLHGDTTPILFSDDDNAISLATAHAVIAIAEQLLDLEEPEVSGE